MFIGIRFEDKQIVVSVSGGSLKRERGHVQKNIKQTRISEKREILNRHVALHSR